MKPASAALKSLLASRQFYAADLYSITLVDGTVLRYCGGDRDIVSGGNTFPAGAETGPFFDRSDNKAKARWKVGVEVDSLTLDVLPGSATVKGLPFLAACRTGVFDGAELQLERAFMPTYGDTSAGTVIVFVGRIAEIDCGRSLATLTVNSHLELLNLQLPRNLWMPGCVNTLGDASCTVNLPSFAVNGTVASGSTASAIWSNSLNQADGYFALGKVQMTGGQNAGLWRSVVVDYANPGAHLFGVTPPFPSVPAIGDAFTIYPGCDKTFAGTNGCLKFANQANFRGAPFVPTPETAV